MWSGVPNDLGFALVSRFSEEAAKNDDLESLRAIGGVSRQWRDASSLSRWRRIAARRLLNEHGVPTYPGQLKSEIDRLGHQLRPGTRLIGDALQPGHWSCRLPDAVADDHASVAVSSGGLLLRWDAANGLALFQHSAEDSEGAWKILSTAGADNRRSCAAWSVPKASKTMVAAVASWGDDGNCDRNYAIHVWSSITQTGLCVSEPYNLRGPGAYDWDLDDLGVVARSPSGHQLISWSPQHGQSWQTDVGFPFRAGNNIFAINEERVWAAPHSHGATGKTLDLWWRNRRDAEGTNWNKFRLSLVPISRMQPPERRKVDVLPRPDAAVSGCLYVTAGTAVLFLDSLSANQRFLSLNWREEVNSIEARGEIDSNMAVLSLDDSIPSWQERRRDRTWCGIGKLQDGILAFIGRSSIALRRAATPWVDDVEFEHFSAAHPGLGRFFLPYNGGWAMAFLNWPDRQVQVYELAPKAPKNEQ